MTKASTELELLVQRIQKQLAPQAEVLHNVKLVGRKTGVARQIDVLMVEKVGQYEIKIVIDCKDYKHPIDVKGVEEFYGLLEDVGAQKGVLVCPRGFSKAAKTRAEGLQIDLYSPFDTDAHKWQVKATIPAVCDFRSAGISFGFRCSRPVPLMMPNDFYSSLVAHNENGEALGTSLEVIAQKWNDGEITEDAGETCELKIFGDQITLVDNGYGMKVPVELTATLYIKKQLYYGQLPVPTVSGFKDEMSGQVITNAFSIGMLDPDIIENEWQKINNEAEAPIKPVIIMRGVVCWAV